MDSVRIGSVRSGLCLQSVRFGSRRRARRASFITTELKWRKLVTPFMGLGTAKYRGLGAKEHAQRKGKPSGKQPKKPTAS